VNITREGIERTYNRYAVLYDLEDIIFLGAKQRTRRRVIELAEIAEDKKVLDVMTGTGELSLLAARAGGTVVGIDFSKPMLTLAKRKMDRSGLDNVALVVADAENMPFPANYFDVVVCSFGLDTAYDPERVVYEMERVAKTDASIVAAYKSYPANRMVRMPGKVIDMYLKHCWQSKNVDMKNAFRKAKIKIIEEEILYSGMVKVITGKK